MNWSKLPRSEFLEIAKERALAYVNKGDLDNAWASLVSDLRKNPHTANHEKVLTGYRLILSGKLKTQEEMREFIENFN